MGGRIHDIAVVENNPDTFFVGAASGGVWKTTNGGVTFTPVFDKELNSSIGDLAIAPSDRLVVWVGTGEPNNRQSSSWGNGVYKSTDGGKTWNQVGLDATRHIGRIVIHPTNPDVVYVAALGSCGDRILSAASIKPPMAAKPGIAFFSSMMIPASWMSPWIRRVPILFTPSLSAPPRSLRIHGGGPGSGIYKTTDGGATWKKLTKDLPEGDTGRIALTVYRKDPNIVYALIENAKGGTFRSEDKGESWKKMSDVNPRPSYYSQLIIDPSNDLRIWALGANIYYSEDGGKSYTQGFVTNKIHGDFHTLWIDPSDSNHILAGGDGGIQISRDGGRNWVFDNSIAIGQFYEVSYDMQQPYTVCVGLQDNAAWCGPSRTSFNEGITNDDWVRVVGGDGFFAMRDPSDPNIVYAESQDGNLSRRNLATNEARPIKPQFKEGEPPYRFNWNTPLVISSYDPKTIYYGGNFLF